MPLIFKKSNTIQLKYWLRPIRSIEELFLGKDYSISNNGIIVMKKDNEGTEYHKQYRRIGC